MSFKPDYGLTLLKEGMSRTKDIYFHNFILYNLGILGMGKFTTAVDMPLNGIPHALTLDFDQKQLGEILSEAPKDIVNQVRNELSRDSSTPRYIDFDTEFTFGMRSRLGEIQQAPGETYVPLIVQEILKKNVQAKLSFPEKLTKVELQYVKNERIVIRVTCEVTENGDLRLDDYSAGGITEAFFGHDDCERIVTVKNEYKDTVMLNLIKERFTSISEFTKWMKEKEIPLEDVIWP